MINFNDKYFSYDMIGEFRSNGSWIHPRRIIKSYEIILVLEGTVYICEENTEYSLKKNDVLLLEPDKIHFGTKASEEKTRFYWFHFYTDINVNFKFSSGNDVYDIKQMLKMLLHVTNSPSYSQNYADALAYQIVEEFNLLTNNTLPDHLLVTQINEYIRNNISTPLSVKEISEHFGYNPDYIGKVFCKACKIGLKEYISEQRIKKAKDILLTTNLSVKEISYMLGFSEENLFIKFFTYHENISPSSFRKKYNKTHINNK